MQLHLVARSISRSVEELLQRPFAARVLATFDQACDLITADGEVLALVTPAVGDGPLNVIVGEGPARVSTTRGTADTRRTKEEIGLSFSARGGFQDRLLAIEPGTPAHHEGGKIRVGALEVALAGAKVWEPRPDWAALRARRGVVAGRLGLLRVMTLEQAPGESLVGGVLGPCFLPTSPIRERRRGDRGLEERAGAAESLLAAFGRAAESLCSGWAGDGTRLQEGAEQLAGLGGGLTPAGDDFLCGAMLAAWLSRPEPGAFCDPIVEAAAPRTTTLSAALLRAAGRGECSTAWHHLFAVLAEECGSEASPPAILSRPQKAGDGQPLPTEPATRNTSLLRAAVQGILAHGATSGADALAGFLWVAS